MKCASCRLTTTVFFATEQLTFEQLGARHMNYPKILFEKLGGDTISFPEIVLSIPKAMYHGRFLADQYRHVFRSEIASRKCQ